MTPTIPPVRILPMDSREEPGFAGKSAHTIQQEFFLDKLIRPGGHPGRFRYRRAGLAAPPGTIVLFQFAGHIIASAVLNGTERYNPPQGPHKGAMYFDPTSIKVFDPVGADVVSAIWPEVTRFGQAKWKLDGIRFPDFERRLTGVKTAKL